MPHAQRMDHIDALRRLEAQWLEKMPAEILVLLASESLDSWKKLQEQAEGTSMRQTMRTCLFRGHAREQALLRFPYLEWISESQRSDLMKDDKLPWGEEVVLRHAGLSPDIRFELLRPSTLARIRQDASKNTALMGALEGALRGPRRPRDVQFLEIPWKERQTFESPWKEIQQEVIAAEMPLGSSRMCTWRDKVLLHSQPDDRVVICDALEGGLTLVPSAARISASSMLHVDKDTLFTCGGDAGELNAIDLGTGVCQHFPSTSTRAARKDCIACTDAFLWASDVNGGVEVWRRSPLTYLHTLQCTCVGKLAAWRDLGFTASPTIYIYVWDGPTGRRVRTIITSSTVERLAVLSDKMLCAADSNGQVEAWSLTGWSRLWTCSLLSDYTCTCLMPRGVGLLLYAGSTHVDGKPVHKFAAIDDTGKIIYDKCVPAQMVAMANTQTAVFARGAGLHVWRAD